MNQQWQKLIDLVVEEVRGAARFRWWALLVAWVICMAGWAVVAMQPNLYAAGTRVFVDTRTALDPVLQGMTINQDINAQINLVSQSLLGDAQLQKLAHEIGLDGDVTTDDDRARLIAKIRNSVNLGAAGTGGSGRIYTLGYISEDRDTSLKAVTFLLDAFRTGALSGKRADTESSQEFLRQQIADKERELREAEQRVVDFKRQNVGQMPGAQGDYFTRLQAAMQEVETLRARLAVAVTQRDALQRQLAGTGDGATVDAALDMDTPTTRAIQETEDRLQELLLQFTENWPAVVSTKETLEQLKARRQQELAALRSGATIAAGGATANPVIQKIQVALNDADVEIAGLRSELAGKEATVGYLRGMVNVVPEVEAKYSQLNRDYDIKRAAYNEFVSRLDKANLGEEAESAESIKFEVINPPFADFKPVEPNRPLLMSAILLFGLGAGAGLAYLLHMLRPVFHSNQAIESVTGFPVLGVVAMTWLDRYQRHRIRSYAGYAVGVLGLVAVLVALLRLQPLMPFTP